MIYSWWCAFSAVFGMAAVVCTGVASGTSHWFEVINSEERKLDKHGTPGILHGDTVLDSFPYPYHCGLWMTCYEERIPNSG